jgi:hypothetical protein
VTESIFGHICSSSTQQRSETEALSLATWKECHHLEYTAVYSGKSLPEILKKISVLLPEDGGNTSLDIGSKSSDYHILEHSSFLEVN